MAHQTLALLAAQTEPRFTVEPLHTLVIAAALAIQQQAQPRRSVAPMLLRQLDQAAAHGLIPLGPARTVALTGHGDLQQPANMALAQLRQRLPNPLDIGSRLPELCLSAYEL